MNKNTAVVYKNLSENFNQMSIALKHDLKPSVALKCLRDLIELDMVALGVTPRIFKSDISYEAFYVQNYDSKNLIGIDLAKKWDDESDAADEAVKLEKKLAFDRAMVDAKAKRKNRLKT